MKFFDTLYYAVYCFVRSIGKPHRHADACAGIFMPSFFMMSGFIIYYILAFKWYPKLLPPKNGKPVFEGLVVAVWVISFVFYGKRGPRIILEYGKSKNQKFYIWLGGIFLTVTISFPVLMWFLLRAIM